MSKLKKAYCKNNWCMLGVLLGISMFPWLTALADTAYNTLTYSNVMSFGISRTASGVVPVALNGRVYLYGTLTNISRDSGGAIYRTTTDGSIVETIYQLQDGDGYNPTAGLVLAHDGNLYGVTAFGPRVGVNTQAGSGTVFRIATDGSGYTTLHQFDPLVVTTDAQTGFSFSANNDGAFPAQTLADGNDGFLYGVTSRGGANGTGAIFRVGLDGNNFQVLHSFGKIDPQTGFNANYTHEGAFPAGSLMFDQDTGYLYGVTSGGGDAANGTLYRIQSDGSQFQTIFSFEPTNGVVSGRTDTSNCHGASPSGRPLLVSGVIYGVTKQGGNDSANCNGDTTGSGVGFGTVYAVKTSDIPSSGLIDYSLFSTIHDFTGGDGQSPSGDLVLSMDGVVIYGETTSGASTSTGVGTSVGSVFSIDLRSPTTSFNLAHAFDTSESFTPTGFLVQNVDGYLYGTATSGGTCSGGAVFQLRVDGSIQAGDTSCRNIYAATASTSSNSLYGGGNLGAITLYVLALFLCAVSLRKWHIRRVLLLQIQGKMAKK